MTRTDPKDANDLPFPERVRIPAELLESLDADRTQLTHVSEDERRAVACYARRVLRPRLRRRHTEALDELAGGGRARGC